MIFFTYFTKIQGHGTEKILGVAIPSPMGAIPPWIIFGLLESGERSVFYRDIFERFVGPLDVIGVEFRSRGTSAATRSRDSDHAKCVVCRIGWWL